MSTRQSAIHHSEQWDMLSTSSGDEGDIIKDYSDLPVTQAGQTHPGIVEDADFDDIFIDDPPEFSNDDTLLLEESLSPEFSHELEVDNDDAEEDEVLETSSRDDAIAGLENLILSFLTQLSNPGSLPGEVDKIDASMKPKSAKKIQLQLSDRRKPSKDGHVITLPESNLELNSSYRTIPLRSLRYPLNGKGPSIRPFAQLFRVVDLAHEALVDEIPTTKRDVYYKDVPLFKSQVVVDRLVDDIAATLSLGRADLNIRASSKGLVCGSALSIHLIEGESIDVTDYEGVLIPAAEDIAQFSLKDDISWVLIVEKEAVFQTLCRLRLTKNIPLLGLGVMITGKGYPDLATRQLVKTLSDNLPQTHVDSIPILVLVDGDAFGLDIASVYKFGSHALRHESGKLAAARVDLGIDLNSLIPISHEDEKKAFKMLGRPPCMLPTRWKKELMALLHSRRKAETEILSSVKGKAFAGESGDKHPLVRYVTSKILAHMASPDSPTGINL
ncbi:hypothetical protein EW146_g4075 [Bondarzewia mesenterica]|uniref:DNA topoisomerase (ATP-hydrolyzing) n=1 Tax=Bondarzewia mesenterica TaxID=1095465 RepID=A0A4S4LVM9_9AGAM|nr:hypothetical protein EW146_g4075 [Bondarzewia mesenterica]